MNGTEEAGRADDLMNDNVRWLAMQQLLDSALPIGGFSHSFGLETMVQDGRMNTSAQLYAYASAMLLQSWASSDAMVIKAVYRDAPREEWERLWSVERLVHVQRIASETRSGVEKMGRRLLQLGTAVHPQLNWTPLTEAMLSGRCFASHPLTHGYACWLLGVSEERAIQGYLYTCIVTCVNSALRLMSIGQTEAQSLIARLIPHTEEALIIARALKPEEAYASMPMAELAMMRHERLYSRLFMS
jgi:urease accessory protein